MPITSTKISVWNLICKALEIEERTIRRWQFQDTVQTAWSLETGFPGSRARIVGQRAWQDSVAMESCDGGGLSVLLIVE